MPPKRWERKGIRTITWNMDRDAIIAEMGVDNISLFIDMLIEDAYRRFRAGNPVSVVDAMLQSDTNSVSEKAGRE